MAKLAKLHTFGPWQIPTHVTHALCADGRRRYARITADADTYFSIPAQVKVRGKTVSGFITGCEASNGAQDYMFRAVKYGKNYALLPAND